MLCNSMMLASDHSLITSPSATTIINNCSSASNNSINKLLLLNDLHSDRNMSNSVPCTVFTKDDVRSSSTTSSSPALASSSLVVDDAINRMMTTCSPPVYNSHPHLHSYNHSNNETTNGSSGSPGSSGRPIGGSLGGGGGGRNKRKNFQPRCTIPTTMDDITTTSTTDQSSLVAESCAVMNVDDGGGNNKNNNSNLNKSIEDLLNSSLTNSLITRMITDMNSQPQQQQHQQLQIPTLQPQSSAVENVRIINKTLMNEHQPLDLSNQELDPSQTNRLLEMFLLRNMRNQFLNTITPSSSSSSSSPIPFVSKDVQSNSGGDSGKKPRLNQNPQRSQPIPTKLQFGLSPSKPQTTTQQSSKRTTTTTASTTLPPDNMFAMKQSSQLSNSNNFLDLFQIYNNNRENYLKLLHNQQQQQQQLTNQSSQPLPRSNIRLKHDDHLHHHHDHHNNGNGDDNNNNATTVDEDEEDEDEFELPKNHSFDDDSDDDVDDRLSGVSGQHSMPDLFNHPKSTKHNSSNKDNNGLGPRRSTIESPSTSTLSSDQNQNQMEGNNDDIEKLKQLQHLYKLKLMQSHGGTISSPVSSLTTSISPHNNPFDALMLQQSQNKLPNSSSRDNCNHHNNDDTTINNKVQPETTTSTIKDNVEYVQLLFKDKIINQKSSSRRPLSSWKQSINACGPGPAPWIEKSTLYSLGIQGELINKSSPIDYTNYVKRYANGNECGNNLCKEKSYREHFHCNALSCNSRVFMKKEEMIRHFKWHKKRDESLTHGFLRCSPGDNCVERFKTCPHHHKQTHYHCLKRGCDKVYISTSDVQMHANYHRKDTAIIQEGFQRFRATENCLLECCAFFGQKTTHFHCRRDNCNHTFKNKADMEKHKSYHIRDEQLARDGFKKFMKHETCTFEECRSSRVCNHIHCIRSGCTHILHSTNQLYLHKCKHERCEKELAYRKYRLAQSIYKSNQFESNQGNNCIRNRLAQCGINLDCNLIDDDDDDHEDGVNESFEALLLNHVGEDGDEHSALENLSQRLPLTQIGLVPIEDIVSEDISEAKCPKLIQRHNQIIADQCNFEYEPPKTLLNSVEHFNCNHCNICWLDQSSAFKHAWKHVIQEEIVSMIFKETNDENLCNDECSLKHTIRHYHCKMLGCPFVIPLQDRTLKMLEHYKFHEDQQIMCPLEEYMATNSTVTLSNETPVASKPSSSSTTSSKSSSSKQHPPETNNNNNNSSSNNNNNNSNKINNINVPNDNVSGKTNKPETSQSLQVFPTGTTLISVDGMPILKRKRGRPPKNRTSTELLGSKKKGGNNSSSNSNQHSDQSMAPKLGTMSSFELAQAFNLSLDHAASIFNHIPASRDDLSKTIPIPLIMPYIKSSIHIGFYVFDGETLCPDVTCQFLGQKHFHCSKPRCYYSTNRDDILQEHSKDFHDNIDILEGFVYFDDNIDCKLPSCQFNKRNKHFHCTRTGCSFSFVRYSLMGSHDEKHFRERLKSNPKSSISGSLQEDLNLDFNKSDESQCSLLPNDDLKLGNDVDDEDDDDHHQLQQLKHPNNDIKNGGSQIKNESLLQTSLQKLLDGRMNALGVLPSIPTPFTSAITATTTISSISSDEVIKQHSAFDENNVCNSPFCKLKRRIHFHCNICNQAFTTYERLVPHYIKHIDSMYPDNRHHHHNSNVSNESESISNAVSNPYNFTNEFFQAFFNNFVNLPPTTSPVNNPLLTTAALQALPSADPTNSIMKTLDIGTSEPNSKRRRSSFSSDGSSNDYGSKKPKQEDGKSDLDEMNNPPFGRSNNNSAEDSSPPPPSSSSNSSYSRFRFNEDCGFPFCVYREHQTHFHCMRKDCGYSFCDKTRFVQHTARHERLDTLMGGDFQQFRSSVTCGHIDCIYVNANISTGNKTSHFHCLKCDYVCADTNKVVAHRRQHAKMDNISAAGFEKYAPNQDCYKELCNYKLKQTHYHCSTCNYSVLGLSQMSSHKQKHQQQLQTQPTQHPHSPTSDPTPSEE